MFKALERVNLIKNKNDIKELNYSKSGRTDKKVSATGNVFSMTLNISPKENFSLIRRINSNLPKNIVILGYTPVPFNFCARKSTFSRTYHFYFFSGDLDLNKMNQACKYLIGEHDFINFCKYTKEYDKCGTVRKVFDCFIEKVKFPKKSFPISRLVIKGSSFLWH